ncbi:MAG TPA: type II secretion system protein [Candidatus Acidoferrum sp.]|nr:type II secretion system protein [Candidatus Acidoferrum sp.]
MSRAFHHPSSITKHKFRGAFTLLELLVVISILGILAGLTVPVLKNFGKGDATLGASRQLLDGVARARQLAMSQRTTVFMVFLPTNYWMDFGAGNTRTFPNPALNSWWGNLPASVRPAVTNLADKQLSGYNFVAYGAIGDQPGQHAWHYLDRWQALPEGNFIARAKFTNAPGLPGSLYVITDPVNSNRYSFYGFHVTNTIPFPTEQGTNTFLTRVVLPYIAFNYLGQLTVDGVNLADQDEYIPLAHGSVFAALDPVTKTLQLPGAPPLPNSPEIQENPPGNSTNLAYNIVHIDRLTGRAVLKYHKLTP